MTHAVDTHDGRIWGAVEAGGTKMVCGVGREDGSILLRERFPTTTPEESFDRIAGFFREAESRLGPLSGLGIVAFGPVDVRDPGSAGHGRMLTTPKPGWQGAHWVEGLSSIACPKRVETDVNGAAMGEAKWGAARGLSTVVYITVGTGIGGGILVNGSPLHGVLHPEVGHMRLPRAATEGGFPGACPFHGDCLEGLASGPAMKARWGVPAETLPADHPAWEEQASHLAWACINLACVVSPQRIILGGGVMQQEGLFPRVRKLFTERLAGYLPVPEIRDHPESYIVPPGLGQDAGLLGALLVARQAAGA